MIKREELTNPSSCMSKALPDEMTFVLLARDIAAPATIEFWVEERIRLRKNSNLDEQILEAVDCAHAMRKQKHLMDRERLGELHTGARLSEESRSVEDQLHEALVRFVQDRGYELDEGVLANLTVPVLKGGVASNYMLPTLFLTTEKA